MTQSHRRVSIAGFVALAIVSGVTIGLGKVVTQLYAIGIGARPFEIGVIGAMESVGMMLMTVPAGYVIARKGARQVYFVASLGPMLINLLLPFAAHWGLLAAGRAIIGLCIPFRTVSMNGAFLEQLPRIGENKAGWYRGSLTFGMAMLGPAVATALTHRLNYTWCFVIVASLFGLMAAFSLNFFPQGQDHEPAAPGASVLGDMAGLLRNRDVAESCAIEFLSGATGSLFGTFVILTAMAIPGLSAQDGIHVMIVQGGTVMLALFAGGALIRRVGRKAAYLMGWLGAMASLAVTGFATNFAFLAAGAVLLSSSSAAVHMVNMVMLGRLPGPKSRISGLYGLCSMIGSVAGAFAGGLLSDVTGVQGIFLAWLPVVALAPIIWAWIASGGPLRKPETEAQVN